jgi:hypothetical protein
MNESLFLQAHCQSPTGLHAYQSFGKELAKQNPRNFKIFLPRAVARKFLLHDKFKKIHIPRQFSGTETNKLGLAHNTDNMGKLFVTLFAFTPALKTNM